MKNIILTVIFLVVFSFSLKGQEINLGLKGGLNLSTVTGDESGSVGQRLAYHFGGFANISLSENFSLIPEVLYFSIGSTSDISLDTFNSFDTNPDEITSVKSVNRANYLAVLINFRYSLTKRFGLDLGPQVSFLLNSLYKIKEVNNEENVSFENTKASGNFMPDYGVNVGFTFLPKEKITIQLRYYQGLKNFNQDTFLSDIKRSNVAFQLSLGYIIL